MQRTARATYAVREIARALDRRLFISATSVHRTQFAAPVAAGWRGVCRGNLVAAGVRLPELVLWEDSGFACADSASDFEVLWSFLHCCWHR